MHETGSLICNQHDELMVKMTTSFLLCSMIAAGDIDKWHDSQKNSPVECEEQETISTLTTGTDGQPYSGVLRPICVIRRDYDNMSLVHGSDLAVGMRSSYVLHLLL